MGDAADDLTDVMLLDEMMRSEWCPRHRCHYNGSWGCPECESEEEEALERPVKRAGLRKKELKKVLPRKGKAKKK